MSVETLVSVEQYLNTAYDPDVEYVDGILWERNVGDWLHSLIQSNITYALLRHIWLIDPRLRQLSVFSAGDLVRVDGPMIRQWN